MCVERSLDSLLDMVLPTPQDLGLKPRFEDWGQVSLLMSHLSSQLFIFTIIIYFETGARSVAQAGLEFIM